MKTKTHDKLRGFPPSKPTTPGWAAVLGGSIAAAALVLSSTGCGGGGGGTSNHTPISSSTAAAPTTPTTRQTGAATLTFPALASSAPASGRLLPAYAPFIKVEFLDVDANGQQVAVPLYAKGGQQYPLDGPKGDTGNSKSTTTPFDVIDRTKSTQHSYYFLPLKNLVLRVSAYKGDPTDPSNGSQKVVAFAEVPFLPKALLPDGSLPPDSNVGLTLQTAITSLEIMGSDTLQRGGTESDTYYVVAKSGNDYVLNSVADATNSVADPAIRFANFVWNNKLDDSSDSVEIVSGFFNGHSTTTNDAVAEGYVSFAPPGAGNQSRRLTVLGNQSGVVQLSVSDPAPMGSGFTATKRVTLTALPGAAQITLPVPPPGTRSIQVQIDDQVDKGIDTSNQDVLAAPIQITENLTSQNLKPGSSNVTLNTTEKNAPIPAGTHRVWVRCYSGANATGAMIGDFILPGVYFLPGKFQPGSMAPLPVVTVPSFLPTPLIVRVLRGTYYNNGSVLSQITKPTAIAEINPASSTGNIGTALGTGFAFLGGNGDVVLQLVAQVPASGTNTVPDALTSDRSVGGVVLNTDVFNVAFNQTPVLPSGAVISPAPGSNSQTYLVSVPDVHQNSDASTNAQIAITDPYLEALLGPGKTVTTKYFPVSLQANKGGNIGSITIQ